MSCNNGTSSSLPGLTVHISAQGQFDQCMGAPCCTFFSTAVPRLHHYALGDVYQSIQGTLGFGNTVTINLDRVADLIGAVNLRYTLLPWTENAGVAGDFDASDIANAYAYTNAIGYFGIDYAELLVGGTVLDRLTGDTLYIMDQFLRPEGLQAGRMVGDYPTYLDRMEKARFNQDILVPLTFGPFRPDREAHWLPSVAIYKQRIELKMCMRPLAQLIHTEGTGSTAYDAGLVNAADVNAILPNGGSNNLSNVHLQQWVVLLTQPERKRLPAHESNPTYTIYSQWHTKGQTFDIPAGQATGTQRSSINNYMEAFFLVPRLRSKWNLVLGTATARGYEWTNFEGSDVNMTGPAPGTPIPAAQPALACVRFQLNSQERVNASWINFTDFMPWFAGPRNPANGIGMYSFSARVHTPHASGGLNMSMIDHQDWTLTKFNAADDLFVEPYYLCRQIAEQHSGIHRPMFTS